MSEHAPRSHEAHESLSSAEKHEVPVHVNRHEKYSHKAEKSAQHQAHEARKHVAETAHNQDKAIKELSNAEESPQLSTPTRINQELKKVTLQRELKAIRRKLPANEQKLSRVVHQPVVRALSEAASTTVSRPSGMLGGGILAFLGTTSYLFMARYLGFVYNYSVVFALFIIGFVLGVVLEMGVHMATSSRRHAND